MKKVVVFLVMFMAIQMFAQAIPDAGSKEIKRALSYQSLIKDSLGNAIEDGKYLVTFRLYDAVNSTEPVWFENQNVYITDGILNVLLGEKQRLIPELFINPLWVTLEINKEESDKQYVSASSYSMYSGLVDLNAFAPSDDFNFSLSPDGRIIIELINPDPIPITDPNPVLNSVKFGLKVPDPLNASLDSYQYLTMNNRNGVAVGAFYYNIKSDKYKAGDDFEDFVVSAKDGRDLVLMSESGTYGTNREVSIGTLSSPNDLKVTGNSSVTGVLTSNSINSKFLKLGNIDPVSSIESLKLVIPVGNEVGGFLHSLNNPAWNGGDSGEYFGVYADNGIDVVIKSNRNSVTNASGNVFIGTYTCPNDVYVYGKMTAREVNVKLNVWPDYVFKKDYNLLPLSEIESHINSFGRLPGMPSEKEVVENGLNINEMQLKLVEKIEELTLHLIRLEKENTELQNRIDKITQ